MKTWGDLLDTLDRELAGTARVVTAVRFDGVDQPSIRDAAVLAVPVADLRCVDVETAAAADLLAASIAVGRVSIGTVADYGVRIAESFRSGRIAAANADLTLFLDAVRMLTTLTATLAQAVHVELAELGTAGGSTASDVLEQVRSALETLVVSQTNQRWEDTASSVAETLAPAIARWDDVFAAIERRAAQ